MPIYALGALEPDIDPTAYVHPDAVLIGDVRLGPESSVWPGAVLRADDDAIIIGARSNVQDGSVIHVSAGLPTVIHEDVLIGHLAHLEGCVVHRRGFIGNGAIVMNRVVVGEGALVAANTVLLNDTDVPAGALAVGVPATIRPGAANARLVSQGADHYVLRGRRYRDDLRRIA
ncbi:MAG: gamma carbonic anhydrase family protein [Acidobacteria bacterium]|nr:gamma carbonic anhydrase family protein [Acidobacteriota bacterium]